MRAEVLGELRRARARPPARLAAVGVELEVREVRAAALERAQRVERRAPVARDAEVVAVDVDRVRQAELVHRAGDRVEHLPRRDAGDVVVERGDVAVAVLPALDAARVDELDAVAARRLEPPGDRVAHARRVARG